MEERIELLVKRCRIALQIGPVLNELPDDFVSSVLRQGEYTIEDIYLATQAARILNAD